MKSLIVSLSLSTGLFLLSHLAAETQVQFRGVVRHLKQSRKKRRKKQFQAYLELIIGGFASGSFFFHSVETIL